MAIDAFLKLGDIDGESGDAAYPKWFQLKDFRFSVHSPATVGTGTGAAGGKADLSAIPIMTEVGASGPDLWLKSINGDHIPEATIVMRKSGGTAQVEFVKVTLSHVYIKDYSFGSGFGDSNPDESWNLLFTEMKYEYQGQDNLGAGLGWVGKNWNVQSNTGG